MPLRTSIDVDVDAVRFAEFQEAFEKYRSALDKLPSAWAGIGAKTSAVRQDYLDMTAALMAHSEGLARLNRETDAFAQNAGLAERFMAGVARNAEAVAGHVGSAVTGVLRIGGVLAGSAALVTGGSLWGLDRLAASNASTRRRAMGLGVSGAEMQSFELNAGRYLDAPSFLSNVNSLLTSQAGFGALSSMGLGGGQLAGMNTAQASVEILKQAYSTLQSTDEHAIQEQFIEAQGFGQAGFTADNAKLLKNMSGEEFAALIAQIPRDTAAFAMSPDARKSWQDLDVQLKRATTTLWNVFGQALAPLAPDLTRLSEEITGLVLGLKDSGKLEQWVGVLGGWIKDFGESLTDGTVRKQLEGFARWIAGEAVALHNVLARIGLVTTPAYAASEAGPGAAAGTMALGGILGGGGSPTARSAGSGQASNFVAPSGSNIDKLRAAIAAAGGNESTQAALLSNFQAESGINPANVAAGGDTGVAQWTGSRKRQLYSFAQAKGLNPLGIDAQAGFLNYELTTNPQFKTMIQRMNAVPPTEAAKIGGYTFEQGGGDPSLFGDHTANQAGLDAFHSQYAQKFYESFHRQVSEPAPASQPDTPGRSSSNDNPASRVMVRTASANSPHISVLVHEPAAYSQPIGASLAALA
jgi:uncharacterized protein YukE